MQLQIAAVTSIPLLVIVASCWYPEEPEGAALQVPSAILENAESDREKVVAHLSRLSFLVGQWRGVAQPKRGSNTEAWSEKGHAVWRFDAKTPCLLFTLKPGKKSSHLFFAAESGSGRPIVELFQPELPSIVLQMTVPEISTSLGSSPQTTNQDASDWEFEAIGDRRVRITIRKLNDIRMTMLFEEKTNAKSAWRRQYEIGLTREGERLAAGNTGERECVVTGGLGVITVTHAGKSYFVCCEGCKQAFEADPEGTLATFRERLKKKSPQN